MQQSQQELEAQKAALARQQQEMQEQQQKMAEAQAKIDANKAAIEEANKRFGQLDDYNILDEVTVYFANGKVTIDPKYKPQLLAIGGEGQDDHGLHDPGERLCLSGGQCGVESEAERRPGQQSDSVSAAAGSYSTD